MRLQLSHIILNLSPYMSNDSEYHATRIMLDDWLLFAQLFFTIVLEGLNPDILASATLSATTSYRETHA
jgi:hypothetical protein